MNYTIVDVQGFKDKNNTFIIKEFAVADKELTQMFLIKPPYPFSSLTLEEKKQVLWLEKNKGIRWSEGYIDYREFRREVVKYLFNKNIITKGLEKVKWIKELCMNNEIVNIESTGCPKLSCLQEKYCKNESYNCCYHVKECALKNVLCLRKWCIDNEMYFC